MNNLENFDIENENQSERHETGSEVPTLDEACIRRIFTEGVSMENLTREDDFLDKAYERYEKIMQDESLNHADGRLVLDVFWSLTKEFLKISDEVEFPESLKEKLVSDPERLLQFVKYIQSWRIDMDEIQGLKEKMSPEEEKFFWQTFHRKFNIRSNRGFRELPQKYQEIIAQIIESDFNNDPEKPVSVLDLGCGPEANALRDLKEKYKDKIDAFGINMEIYNQSSKDVSLKEGDIRNMPFENDRFDLAYEIGVSGYFRKEEDMEAFIHDVMRVLKSGGKLLLTDAKPDLKFLDKLGVKYEISQKEPLVIVKK